MFKSNQIKSENVFLLDAVLRHAHTRRSGVYLASVDIRKAFDSLSHCAVIGALRAAGVPSDFLEYIRKVYSKANTIFAVPGHAGRIHPTCGVRQGDPLSPLIFNLVVDGLIRRLGETPVGVDMGGGVRVGSSAFADDIVLFATTGVGLQKSMDLAVGFLSNCNLIINHAVAVAVLCGHAP